MAGKHLGGDNPYPDAAMGTPTNLVSHHFSPKLDKAYSEGRAPGTATNPHPDSSPAHTAFDNGRAFRPLAADQRETCWSAGA